MVADIIITAEQLKVAVMVGALCGIIGFIVLALLDGGEP